MVEVRARAGMLVTEKQFQHTVVEYARALGYLVYHQIDMGRKDPETGRVTFSRRIGPGFPDLVIAGHGKVIFAELKAEKGKLTKDQEAWQAVLRVSLKRVYVWRPSDWDEIEEVLKP